MQVLLLLGSFTLAAAQCSQGSFTCVETGLCVTSCPSPSCPGPRYVVDSDRTCRPLSQCGVETPGFLCAPADACVSDCTTCVSRPLSKPGWHKHCYAATPTGCAAVGLSFCSATSDCVIRCSTDCPNAPLALPDSSCAPVDPRSCSLYSKSGRLTAGPSSSGQLFCPLTLSCVAECASCTDTSTSFTAESDIIANTCAFPSPAGCAAIPVPPPYFGTYVYCPSTKSCVLALEGTVPCTDCPAADGVSVTYLSEGGGACVDASECTALRQHACATDAFCHPRREGALATCGGCVGADRVHPLTSQCTTLDTAAAACDVEGDVDGVGGVVVASIYCEASGTCVAVNTTAAVVDEYKALERACGSCQGMFGVDRVDGRFVCAVASAAFCSAQGRFYCKPLHSCVAHCGECVSAQARADIRLSGGGVLGVCVAADGSACKVHGQLLCLGGGLEGEAGLCVDASQCSQCTPTAVADVVSGLCVAPTGAACAAAGGTVLCPARGSSAARCVGGQPTLSPSVGNAMTHTYTPTTHHPSTLCGRCDGLPFLNVTSNTCVATCDDGIICMEDLTCKPPPPLPSPLPAPFPLSASPSFACSGCGGDLAVSALSPPATCVDPAVHRCVDSFFCPSLHACVKDCANCTDTATPTLTSSQVFSMAHDVINAQCVSASGFGCRVLGGGQSFCKALNTCVSADPAGCSSCFDVSTRTLFGVYDATHARCVSRGEDPSSTAVGCGGAVGAGGGGGQFVCESAATCVANQTFACAACAGAPIADPRTRRCVSAASASCDGGWLCESALTCVYETSNTSQSHPCRACAGAPFGDESQRRCVAPTPSVCRAASRSSFYCPTPPSCVEDCTQCGGSTPISDFVSRTCVASDGTSCSASNGQLLCPTLLRCVPRGDCSSCTNATTAELLSSTCVPRSGERCRAADRQALCAPVGSTSRCVRGLTVVGLDGDSGEGGFGVSGRSSLTSTAPHGCVECSTLPVLDTETNTCVASQSLCSNNTAWCETLAACIPITTLSSPSSNPASPRIPTPPEGPAFIPLAPGSTPSSSAPRDALATPIPTPTTVIATAAAPSACAVCPLLPSHAPAVALCVAPSGAACAAANPRLAFCKPQTMCVDATACATACPGAAMYDPVEQACVAGGRGCFASTAGARDCAACPSTPLDDNATQRCVAAEECGARGRFVCRTAAKCVATCEECGGVAAEGSTECVGAAAPDERFGGVFFSVLFVALCVFAVLVGVGALLCGAVLSSRSRDQSAVDARRDALKARKRVFASAVGEDVGDSADIAQRQAALKEALEDNSVLREHYAKIREYDC